MFRVGFGRYLATLEIFRPSPSRDLYSKSAATAPKFRAVKCFTKQPSLAQVKQPKILSLCVYCDLYDIF